MCGGGLKAFVDPSVLHGRPRRVCTSRGTSDCSAHPAHRPLHIDQCTPWRWRCRRTRRRAGLWWRPAGRVCAYTCMYVEGGVEIIVYFVWGETPVGRSVDLMMHVLIIDPTTVASHGLRWIDYQYVGEAAEREHIRKAVEITTQVCMHALTHRPSACPCHRRASLRLTHPSIRPSTITVTTTGLRHPPRGHLPGQAQHQHAAARRGGGGLPLVRPMTFNSSR